MQLLLNTYTMAFALFLTADSHWTRTPGSLLITRATAWRLNQADVVWGNSTRIAHYPNAHMAVHRIDNDHVLVIDPSRIRDSEGYVVFRPSGSAFTLTPQELADRLSGLGLRLPRRSDPKTPIQFTPALANAAGFLSTNNSQYYLTLGQPQAPDIQLEGTGTNMGNMPTTSPVSPPLPGVESFMLEWGTPAAMQTIATGFITAAGGNVPDEKKIFEHHFYKIPLSGVLFSSPLDQPTGDAERVDELSGLYLVKSWASTSNGGYLVSPFRQNDQLQIYAIEIPQFSVGSGQFSAVIPSKCLIDQIIARKLRRPGLVCSSGGTSTTNACRSVSTNRYAITLSGPMLPPTTRTPVGTISLRRNTTESFSVEFSHATTEPEIAMVRGGQRAINDQTPRVILREVARGQASNPTIECLSIPLIEPQANGGAPMSPMGSRQ